MRVAQRKNQSFLIDSYIKSSKSSNRFPNGGNGYITIDVSNYKYMTIGSISDISINNAGGSVPWNGSIGVSGATAVNNVYQLEGVDTIRIGIFNANVYAKATFNNIRIYNE